MKVNLRKVGNTLSLGYLFKPKANGICATLPLPKNIKLIPEAGMKRISNEMEFLSSLTESQRESLHDKFVRLVPAHLYGVKLFSNGEDITNVRYPNSYGDCYVLIEEIPSK